MTGVRGVDECTHQSCAIAVDIDPSLEDLEFQLELEDEEHYLFNGESELCICVWVFV